ncbi:MAG: hypothetical protein ACT4PE_05575 [Candidatus Eiseniibacteriota bacterium]
MEHYVNHGLSAEATVDAQVIHARSAKVLRNILNRSGADYRWVDYKQTQTEYFRNGYQVWGYGSPGATVETFDGVIHLNFGGVQGNRRAAANGTLTVGNRARVDSMLFGGSTKAPTKPQLVLINNTMALIGSTTYEEMFDAINCTTGVNALSGGSFMYPASEPTRPFIVGSYVSALVMNTTPPDGGVRVHLKSSTVAPYHSLTYDPPASLTYSWPDSIVPGAADTAVVWERLMSHINGSAPIVFASTAGAGYPADSIYNTDAVMHAPGELESSIILYALARFDSLTNGGVWPTGKVPVKLGLTIDGGFARNARLHPRGILAADSSALKSSIDSLAALDIPFVVGVNVCSVATYPSEKGWWAAARKARYSPQPWTGIDSTANSGNSSFLLPIDMWGRYRKRIAFGDSSATGRDTSLWALFRGGLYKCDSIFGSDRVSRFALPPDDDWTPRGMNNSSSGPGVDSVLFAMKRAGFVGVRSNTTDRDCDPEYLPGNPRGWHVRQGVYRDARNGKFKVLGYPGYPLGGGSRLMVAVTDTTHPYSAGLVGKLYSEIYRAWQGMWQLQDWNYDAFPTNDVVYPDSRVWDGVEFNIKDRLYAEKKLGSLIRLSACDFSGDPNGPPARLGWWTVKSLANQFRAINNAANRSIVIFAYPEDINP